MDGELTVGVVIPTHNRKKLLAKTLDSLEAQSRQPDSVVVVADGCYDGTRELVSDREDVKLIVTAGVGAGPARNAGWRSVSVDVVAFIDDDCRADPGWLAGLLAAFDQPEVGLVQGATIPDGPVGVYDRTIQVLRPTGLFESCNIAYRRSVLEELGGMGSGFGTGGRPFGEDTELAWRALRSHWQSVFVEAAVVRHAVFPGSRTGMLREAWRVNRFPYLLREIPELRDYLPGGWWFMRPQSLRAQLALMGALGSVGALAVGRRPLTLVLAAPYLAWLARQTREPARGARIAVRDMVVSAALLSGSVRHRNVVL